MKAMDDIFNLNDAQPEPVAGSLLVARPTIGDPCFGRSVILVVEHSNDGTMGLMMNRIINLTASDVLNELFDITLTKNGRLPLFLGGPVRTDELLFVHDLPQDTLPGGEAIGDSGLYIGGNIDTLKRLMMERTDIGQHIRLCVGYSGWEGGQLADELSRHDWVVLDGSSEMMLLTTPYDQLWHNAVQRFGDRYRLWLNWPVDPHLN